MPGWGLGHLCASPKQKMDRERTRGSWETSEEGQGKDMAGWGRGCGHGEILEVRLVSVVKAGSWAVGEREQGLLGSCLFCWDARMCGG